MTALLRLNFFLESALWLVIFLLGVPALAMCADAMLWPEPIQLAPAAGVGLLLPVMGFALMHALSRLKLALADAQALRSKAVGKRG
ncbi:hypothetical protein SAMN06265795_104259 [Noviherbaspirillum humi]|uniref:Uncharacterized protein n=1 Tax=Noviherbaspirillum humi TaxID=1688639 RepID=A0A239G7C5_9BURK|nr:hypothetical protein [Noviherbaspirillum humi]SNS64353.1 hypothetical protein SAMN06265795_104259 [Noviherbaspirillum humi]